MNLSEEMRIYRHWPGLSFHHHLFSIDEKFTLKRVQALVIQEDVNFAPTQKVNSLFYFLDDFTRMKKVYSKNQRTSN